MLSIAKTGSAKAAVAYYTHLSEEKGYYFAEGAGVWGGSGATSLGLGRLVNAEQFELAAKGYDPISRKPLVQNAGDNHQAGHDLTFSAIKSFSVLWALKTGQQQKKIEEAHQQAVSTTMQYLERLVATRRGQKGKVSESASGVLYSHHLHRHSRSMDPQIHSHNFLFNICERHDKSWGTINSHVLYQHKMMLGALYRAELAYNLRQLGYQIASNGASFEIAGIPEGLREEFSTRSKQIRAELKKVGASSAKAAEYAALSTRKAKPAYADQKLLFASWRDRAKKYGVTPENIDNLLKAAEPDLHDEEEFDPLHHAMGNGQKSTFMMRDLVRVIAEKAPSKGWSIADVLAKAKQLKYTKIASGEIVALKDNRFTTQTMIETEQLAIQTAIDREPERSHQVDPKHVISELENCAYSEEQQKVLRYVCDDSGGVASVRGMAGTGKSYALQGVRQIYEASGYRVRGAALAGKAAEGLEESAGIKSHTIHSLLKQFEDKKIRLNHKDVLIVDEAGMVGTTKMAQLISETSNASAKLILVGDSGQLQPIEAGGIFAGINHAIKTGELTGIRRQHEEWMRKAVLDTAEGRVSEALDAMEQRGRIYRGKSKEETIQKMVDSWAKSSAPIENKLMLAATRFDVQCLNTLAREQVQGNLGMDVDFAGVDFADGDRVLFTRNDYRLGVKNGQLGWVKDITISRTGEAQIQVELENGRTVKFTENQYTDIDHGYAVTVHKSQGVTVDDAFVLPHESMTNKEWSYVAVSRARRSTEIFVDPEMNSELEVMMSRSRQKDLAIDYLKCDEYELD